VDMIRLRRFWALSTYDQWTDDTGNKASLLKVINTGGTVTIWAANRSRPAWVKKATGLDCTGTGTVSALTFGSAIYPGDYSERINGLAVFGDEFARLHVLKEGSIHEMVGEAPYELRVSELQSVADPRNGAANLVHGSYLYFNYEQGLERYVNNTIESVGPNLDEGLPTERKGEIAEIVDYTGLIVTIVDGGEDNYSSVLVFSGLGYCEMWRSPAKGLRIYNAFVQPMPGDVVNRLWVNMAGDLFWLPISINLARKVVTDMYQYVGMHAPGAYLISGWFSFGRKLAEKLFTRIGIVAEIDAAYGGSVQVLYQTDNESTWHYVDHTFDQVAEAVMLSDDDVTGTRVRFMVVVEPDYANSSPKILAMVVEALIVGEYRYSNTLTFRIADDDVLLDGRTPDSRTALQKLALLDTWARSAGTLTMTAFDQPINNLRVKPDVAPIRIIKHVRDENRSTYICQLTLYEVE